MKWNIYFMALLTFAAMTTGCASIGSVFHHERHEITLYDANRVHPHSRQKDTHKRLTLEESRSINKLYGEEISQEGDFIAYYNARHMKPLYPLTKGNIFLVHTNDEKNNSLALLVCTTKGRVDEVILKNNFVVEGKPVISGKFVQQFIGRSLGDSWEMAKVPSDLLSLPEKIRPLSAYPKTSEELANAIRRVLVLAKVLGVK